MRVPRIAARRAAVGSFLLLTMLTWHVEAVGGQLTLTWVHSSGDELGFAVERSTGTAGTFGEIAETSPGVTAYVDSTVADGSTYCYRVRAFNSSAYSAYSNAACNGTGPTIGLAVVKMGVGTGTVISTPSGVICGSSCAGNYSAGTAVTLTATAAPGSAFTGWSGAGCTGVGVCTVVLSASTTVTANFEQVPPVPLTITLAGWVKGTVTSTPAGVSCGQTCAASYPSGTVVTLTASASNSFVRFAGWSGGGCGGSGTCTVTLTAPTAVTATWKASRQ